MHKNNNRNRRNTLLLIAGALSVIIAGVVIIMFSRSLGGIQVRETTTQPTVTTQDQAVTQPASAAQVAQSLHCTKFKDLHTSSALFSIDSGSCYIGSLKYAINTFMNQASRDNWLKAATSLGVNPKWETSTSVVYPSVG